VTPTGILLSIATSLVASIIYATVGGGYRRWFGQQIKITQPAPNAYLAPVEVRRGTRAHPVSGTLRYLPKGHTIWLIVVNETKGRYWPQGFEAVEYCGNHLASTQACGDQKQGADLCGARASRFHVDSPLVSVVALGDASGLESGL
jgi:hypothetical protein